MDLTICTPKFSAWPETWLPGFGFPWPLCTGIIGFLWAPCNLGLHFATSARTYPFTLSGAVMLEMFVRTKFERSEEVERKSRLVIAKQ